MLLYRLNFGVKQKQSANFRLSNGPIKQNITFFGSFYILAYFCSFLLTKNIEIWESFAVGLTIWMKSIILHPPQSNDPFQIPDQQFV